MALRVAVLCSDEPHHRYLVSLLGGRFDLVAVVVEPGAARIRRLRERGRWRDYGWALYHHVRRRLLGLSGFRRAYFALPPGASAPAGREVASINDPLVPEVVSEARPDVTVVIGTSIIRDEVLRRLGPAVLNVHGGCLPDYRGNHCFFFALYDGAFDRIGSTIHFVDAGVDTGDLVARIHPPLRPGDSAEALYCRAEKLAIHHLADLLERYGRTGTLPRAPQPRSGRTFRMRDRKPHHDLLLWLRRRTGRHVLPLREEAEVWEAGRGVASAREAAARTPAPV